MYSFVRKNFLVSIEQQKYYIPIYQNLLDVLKENNLDIPNPKRELDFIHIKLLYQITTHII